MISSTFKSEWKLIFVTKTRFEVEAEVNSKMADLGEGQNSMHRTRARAFIVFRLWGPFLESPEDFFWPEKPFVKL